MSQNAVRAAGIAALNAWHKEIGLVSFIEGEVIFGALSTENPNLRTEVWIKYVIVITVSGQLSQNFTCQNKNLWPTVLVPFVKKLEPYSTVCLTDIHSPDSETTMNSVLIEQLLKKMLWKAIFSQPTRVGKRGIHDKSGNPEWPIRDCIYLPFVDITRPQRKTLNVVYKL